MRYLTTALHCGTLVSMQLTDNDLDMLARAEKLADSTGALNIEQTDLQLKQAKILLAHLAAIIRQDR